MANRWTKERNIKQPYRVQGSIYKDGEGNMIGSKGCAISYDEVPEEAKKLARRLADFLYSLDEDDIDAESDDITASEQRYLSPEDFHYDELVRWFGMHSKKV